MIESDWTTALTVYLSFLLGGLFFLSIWHRYAYRRMTYRQSSRLLTHCSFCGYMYARPKDESLTKCPQCACWSRYDI